MSAVTPPPEARQKRIQGDLNLEEGNTGAGNGSFYMSSASAEFYNPGNTHVKQTLIDLSNGDFNVTGTGVNEVNFDLPGAISFRTDTSGLFSTSVGVVKIESLDTSSSGKVQIESAGSGAGAVKLEASNSTDGQVLLTSAGQGTSVPAINVLATGTTGGGINLESATASSTVKAITLNATNTTNGSIQLVAQGNYADSVPAISLSAPNTTSGRIDITSASDSTTIDAINISTTSTTGGAIHLESTGAGTSDGSIFIEATNVTTGAVKISGNGTSNNSINLVSANGGQTLSAAKQVSIQTTDTIDGIKIATVTPGVPVTIGTSGSTTTIAGNLVTNGTWNEFKPTNTVFYDNIITVNTNPIVNSGGDSGLAIRRQQQPNDVGTGDVVNRDEPKLQGLFGTGSATPGTLKLDPSTVNAPDDYFVGWRILVTSGSGVDQVRTIKSFVSATQVATLYVTADNTTEPSFTDGLDLATAPASGDSYELYNGNYATVIYNEIDDSIDLREAIMDPGSTTIIGGQYTRTNVGELTVKPLSYKYAEISASGTAITVTLNTHGMSDGDKVRIRNPVTATGSITPGVYTVSNVTTNTFEFTNPTSVTTDTSSVVDVDLLETSVAYINKILPQDTGYGTVSVGGLINTQVVILDTSTTSSEAIINIADQVQGAHFIKVYNSSDNTGATACFAVTKRSGDKGNVEIIIQEKAADDHRIDMKWENSDSLKLYTKKSVSGGSTDSFTVTWI
jgi:hypothetical protein